MHHSWEQEIVQSLWTAVWQLLNKLHMHPAHDPAMWGTVPSVGNVAQPPLGKASGERGWQTGPTSMYRFSSGKLGLYCTYTAMTLALAKTPSP